MPEAVGRHALHRDPVAQRGSTVLENVVLFDARLSAGARLIYLAIKHYASKDGGVMPSQAELAEALGVSERVVQLSIRELKTLGLIAIQRRRREPAAYELTELRTTYFAVQERLTLPRTRDSEENALSTETLSRVKGKRTSLSHTHQNRPVLTARKASLVFDALCKFEGLDPRQLNNGEGGRIAKAKATVLESVRAAWASAGQITDTASFKKLLAEREQRVAEEIERRGRRYLETWPNAERSAVALANHWQRFARPDPKREKAEAAQARGERLQARMAEKGVR
jgi:biotin operon repressor